MYVYVASSWRNSFQPEVVKAIRELGHDVYDFRNPVKGDHGFHWSEIDPNWKDWTPGEFRKSLRHDLANDGFAKDIGALKIADATVLVQPCGISAHLELGYACGRNQLTYVILAPGTEPELMYKMVDFVCVSLEELRRAFPKGR